MNSPATILVLDDEPGMLDLLRELLTDGGYRVESAITGGDALMLMEARRPDVVLLNMSLPDASGVTILKRLHTVDKTIPVVILGRPDDDPSARELLEMGAFDYVGKPFRYAKLQRVVSRAVGARRKKGRPGVVVPFRAYRRSGATSTSS